MFVFDESRVSGRRAVAGVVISVLLLIVGGIAAWWSRPTAKPAARSFSCAIIGGDPAAEARALQICQRQAADAARRGPRPSQDPVDPEAMRIWNAMWVEVCQSGTGWACSAPRAATGADVAAVRGVLTGLGYPDAVVRLERAGDPAPDGSVVYGVRLSGGRCLVAFAAMGSGPNLNGLSGPLPGGECLAA